ncbi:MAG: YCF48-related protein [Pseudomonadota bacterium]
MTPHTLAIRAFVACALALGAAAAGAAPAADVLKTPAAPSALAPRALINGLAQAGNRVVGVGQRGHIVYSDNGGQSWTQARVPVSSDLTAVHFPSPRLGWAVGHDGVVLHTEDAGANWTLQLDGAAAAQAMLSHYTTVKAEERLLADARRMVEQGPDKPFLDVWFEDDAHGYVVGAFNLIFRTEDGGRSWLPCMDKVDNPKGFHLNAIRPAGDAVYMVGEQGLVLRKARGADRFIAVPTPYQGSYFGVVGNAGAVIVYGLRGNAYRSTDQGAHWAKVDTGLQTGLTAATTAGEQRFVIVSQAGQVLLSADNGASFTALAQVKPGPASAVLAAGKDALLIGGARGLRVQPLAAQ